MGIVQTIVVLAAFVVATVAAMVVIARGMRKRMEELRKARVEPYVPIEDPLPAPPIISTAPLRAVSALIILWSVAHLCTVSYWWTTGYLVPRKAFWICAAAYAAVAALISGVGGVLLWYCRRFGRKMVAWGEFLFGVMAFLLLVASVVLPTHERAPDDLRRVGYALAVLFAVHLLIDTVLGTAAQRAGRPQGWSEELEWTEPEPTPPFQEPLDPREMF
jgi:hypothetical protein